MIKGRTKVFIVFYYIRNWHVT